MEATRGQGGEGWTNQYAVKQSLHESAGIDDFLFSILAKDSPRVQRGQLLLSHIPYFALKLAQFPTEFILNPHYFFSSLIISED